MLWSQLQYRSSLQHTWKPTATTLVYSIYHVGYFLCCCNIIRQFYLYPSIRGKKPLLCSPKQQMPPLEHYHNISTCIGREEVKTRRNDFFPPTKLQVFKLQQYRTVIVYISKLLYWNVIKMAVKNQHDRILVSSTELCKVPSYRNQKVHIS